MNAEEYRLRMFEVVTIPSDGSLVVHEPKTKVDLTKVLDNHLFRFDAVFDESTSNDTVYQVRCLLRRRERSCSACTLAVHE